MSGRPLEALINLGRVSARQLAEIGVASEAELRKMGALAAYARLRHRFGRAITLNMLYALDGALRGVRWDNMPASDRAALRAKAEALLGKATSLPPPNRRKK